MRDVDRAWTSSGCLATQRGQAARDGARREPDGGAGGGPRLHRPRRRGRDVRAHAPVPAGPALLSLTTGAPLIVTPTYTDARRLADRDPRTARRSSRPATGGPTSTALTRSMARTFEEAIRPPRPTGICSSRAGREDRPRPARTPGTTRAACRSTCASSASAHASARSRGRRARARQERAPSEPWVRAVGRPVDFTFNRIGRADRPTPVVTRRRVRAGSRAFRPDVVHVHEPFTPSTAMWAHAARGARRRHVPHRSRSGPGCTTRPRRCSRRTARRIAVRIAVSARGRARRAPPDRRGVRDRAERRRMSAGSPMAEPADLGPGTKLLFVGRLRRAEGVRRRRRRVRPPGAVAARPATRRGRRRPSGAQRWRHWTRPRATGSTMLGAVRNDGPAAVPRGVRRVRRAERAVRASASCWWRRWRQGCRSWRATSPATTRW